MPEATILCIDNSDRSRNGDFSPSRLESAKELFFLMGNALLETNMENSFGLLTMGGTSSQMLESLTRDDVKVFATLSGIVPHGPHVHFSVALSVAALALGYRKNPRAQKRIVAVITSPLTESQEALEKLGRRLRKDDVAVDVLAMLGREEGGIAEEEEGQEEGKSSGSENPALSTRKKLEAFINAVSRGGGAGLPSRLVVVPVDRSAVDLGISRFVYGDEESQMESGGDGAGVEGVAGGGGGGGGGGSATAAMNFGGFGAGGDAELEAALQASLEDQRQLVERRAAEQQQQQQQQEGAPPPTAPPAAATPQAPPAAAQEESSTVAPPTTTTTNEQPMAQEEEEEYDEAAELARVLALSAAAANAEGGNQEDNRDEGQQQ